MQKENEKWELFSESVDDQEYIRYKPEHRRI